MLKTAALSLCLLTATVGAAEVPLIPEPARPADALAGSIGVCAHLTYNNTMYVQQWPKVRELLGQSGIRIVRDSMSPRLKDLYKNYGIKAFVISEPDMAPLSEQLQQFREHHDLLAAVEGPNEGNLFWVQKRRLYKDQPWPQGVRLYQNDLYAAIKADPLLHSVTVISPSTAGLRANLELAPLSSFDCMVMHNYPGGRMPSMSIDAPDFSNLRNALDILGTDGHLRTIVTTETGYHTCVLSAQTLGPRQPGVSPAAQAKYMPRLIAEYFNAGIMRTILYEFGSGVPEDPVTEPEAAFGLLNQDATPKPAYFAICDLIRLTGESHWDKAAQQWIAPKSSTGALTFALQDAPESVHHTLLRRSNGDFQLLVWNEVPSFDTQQNQDIHNPPVAVTMKLAAPADVTVDHLGMNASAGEKIPHTQTVPLNVTDEVIVVTIHPDAQQTAVIPAPPRNIHVATTNTTAELSWKASPDVTAYWVRCNGRDMGVAPAPVAGVIHFTQKRLSPALRYPYEIVAVSRSGGVSAPAEVEVVTANQFPHLVVTALELSPAHPKPGEKVRFRATVANRGDAATESGITIGVSFSVDGQVICWSDHNTAALAPGREVSAASDNGPGGTATWTAAPGRHRITAVADDVHRITQKDRSGDTITLDVTIPAAP